MGKSSGSPPAAPDPAVTSQAQSASNAATARLTAQLNRVNQVGPTGSITYSQGAAPIDRTVWENDQVAKARSAWDAAHPASTVGGGGGIYSGGASGAGESGDGGAGAGAGGGTALPAQPFDEAAFRQSLAGQATPIAPGQDQWTATTTLSPEQQKLYDLTTKAQTTYGDIANNQLSAVSGALSQPVNTDWEALRKQSLANQLARISPTFDQSEENLRQRLRNSGLTEGSAGWNREFSTFNQGKNDALIAADLRAGDTVGQGIQQTAALRGMPLNEAASLLTGQMVQAPQLQQYAGAQVAPTDVLGAYNTQYQGQLNAYNAQQQSNAAGLGGIFGLAGTLGGAALRYGAFSSDARLKEDIRRIGTADNGLPLYLFRYRGRPEVHFGLMAQDVLPVNPDAVLTMPNGMMAVDYVKALAHE